MIKIKLSEEDIKWLEVGINYLQNKAGTEGISETIDRIIYQAKQKPYTNFDKIKDEMTIEDYCKFQIGNRKLEENRIKAEISGKSYDKWLESEAKDEM